MRGGMAGCDVRGREVRETGKKGEKRRHEDVWVMGRTEREGKDRGGGERAVEDEKVRGWKQWE